MRYGYFVIPTPQESPVPWSREIPWHVYPLILGAFLLDIFLFLPNIFIDRNATDLFYAPLFCPSACQALSACKMIEGTAKNEWSLAKRCALWQPCASRCLQFSEKFVPPQNIAKNAMKMNGIAASRATMPWNWHSHLVFSMALNYNFQPNSFHFRVRVAVTDLHFEVKLI